MKDILATVSAAFIVLFATLILKECGWRGAKLVSTAGLVGLFAISASAIGSLTSEITQIGTGFGISDTAALVVKATGISYIFGIAADICRDMGEGGIGSAVELMGRLELALLALPLIKEAIEMGASFIGG